MKKINEKVWPTLKEMKECWKYKVIKGKKGELHRYNEAEYALYQISLNLLLLHDFMQNLGMYYKDETFVHLGENLAELYKYIGETRCDCFYADRFLRSMGLDDDWDTRHK
ncbi:MAG: hypothetical protein MJ250_05965 [Alphaproteobacteria bacterium]|nr:hypothetical protein [Alphaproteobacteria bacterium]